MATIIYQVAAKLSLLFFSGQMKAYLFSLFTFLMVALNSSSYCMAQIVGGAISPESVMQHYYDAIGGEAAINAVGNLRTNGFFSARGANNEWNIRGTFEEMRTKGPHRLSAFYYADTLLAIGASPSQRFVHQPGLSDFVFIEGVRTISESPVPFTNVKALESASINDTGDLYEVVLWDQDSTRWTVYFDTETFLPLGAKKTSRISLLGLDCEYLISFHDYGYFEGVWMPRRIENRACDLGTVNYYVEAYSPLENDFDPADIEVERFKKLLKHKPVPENRIITDNVGHLSEEGEIAYADLVQRVRARRVGEEETLLSNAGTPFPEFELTTLDGTVVSNIHLEGKVTLVDFWSTYCGSCIEAMPEMAQFTEANPGEEFQIIGVSINTDKETFEAFVLDHPEYSWPMVQDENMSLYSRLNGYGIPTYYVVDRNGIIHSIHLGKSPEMYNEIEELLAKK